MKKYLLYGGIAIAAYLIYRNVFAADAGSQATNASSVDFGVLNPSTW
jgi:hypothetical protein